MPSRKRITMVGAGHNALVYACYLARAGHDVADFERRSLGGRTPIIALLFHRVQGHARLQRGQGDKLCIIDKGQEEITVTNGSGEERRVNIQNEGDYFGEMALLASDSKNATVLTISASELYSLSPY